MGRVRLLKAYGKLQGLSSEAIGLPRGRLDKLCAINAGFGANLWEIERNLALELRLILSFPSCRKRR